MDSLLTALLPFETRKQTKVTDVTILQNTLLSLKENSLDTVLRYLHLGDTEKLLLLLRGMVVNGWEIERCIRIVDAIVKHREGQTFEGMKNALEAMQKVIVLYLGNAQQSLIVKRYYRLQSSRHQNTQKRAKQKLFLIP